MIFLTETKCKIRFIYVRLNCISIKKSWLKRVFLPNHKTQLHLVTQTCYFIAVLLDQTVTMLQCNMLNIVRWVTEWHCHFNGPSLRVTGSKKLTKISFKLLQDSLVVVDWVKYETYLKTTFAGRRAETLPGRTLGSIWVEDPQSDEPCFRCLQFQVREVCK